MTATYKLGLALSGGGIKGFAHLGVLKYLEEIGVRPEILAGTSAGALVGAFYACGYSCEEVFELLSRNGFMKMTSLKIRGGELELINIQGLIKFIDQMRLDQKQRYILYSF